MKLLNFMGKHKRIVRLISLAVIIIGVVLIFVSSRASEEKDEEFAKAVPKVELVNVADYQESGSRINTTGLVESIEQVELKSQVSAKVRSINVDLGDQINPGQILVSFDNDDVMAQLLQAQANLEAAQAQLEEIERGARTEELRLTETQVLSAETAVADAEVNLKNAQSQAEVILSNVYNSALTALKSAANLGKNSILFLSDIQNTYFEDYSQESLRVQDAKAVAVYTFLGELGTGRWSTKFISELAGGVFGLVNEIKNGQTFDEIDLALSEMIIALNKVRDALNTIPVSTDLSSGDRANLVVEKNTIDGQITSVTGSQQGIALQKAANQSLIDGAETGLNNALSALASAQKQLELVKSGASSEQLAVQEARVKLARANLLQAQALFNKTIIRSPISGTLAVLPIRLGELVAPGALVASVVNTNAFEVKTYIESSDLSKVSLGNPAVIENGLEGTVTHVAPSIDPSTKKVEVKVVVNRPSESNLVAGQFVNLGILANNGLALTDVYLLPLQAIRTKTDEASVYTVNENSEIVEHTVILGKILGESVEVIKGIEPDMKIISSVRGLQPGQKVSIK